MAPFPRAHATYWKIPWSRPRAACDARTPASATQKKGGTVRTSGISVARTNRANRGARLPPAGLVLPFPASFRVLNIQPNPHYQNRPAGTAQTLTAGLFDF